jgi:hypothetical protein
MKKMIAAAAWAAFFGVSAAMAQGTDPGRLTKLKVHGYVTSLEGRALRLALIDGTTGSFQIAEDSRFSSTPAVGKTQAISLSGVHVGDYVTAYVNQDDLIHLLMVFHQASWNGVVVEVDPAAKSFTLKFESGGIGKYVAEDSTRVIPHGPPYGVGPDAGFSVLAKGQKVHLQWVEGKITFINITKTAASTPRQMPPRTWKGKVARNTGKVIGVRLTEGGTNSFGFAPGTKITRDGAEAAFSDIKAGDDVVVKTSSRVDSIEAISAPTGAGP